MGFSSRKCRRSFSQRFGNHTARIQRKHLVSAYGVMSGVGHIRARYSCLFGCLMCCLAVDTHPGCSGRGERDVMAFSVRLPLVAEMGNRYPTGVE
ncbi:hypothetical protein BDV41DRAFT_199672 [Aspergillus transmontanensis]|uniref:Uncharacterized protein n=1 Tax=Aspergillus transmontanensis TaxID=1034304 RepID=A0A5N6W2Y4_9EURO|nr:hypothetical protein BDV41DRAFT_199672 [Aspergillus transmontanensis]